MHPNLGKTFLAVMPWLVSQSGDFGVELEFEGVRLPAAVQGWETHTEGSLRGQGGRIVQPGEDAFDTPREFVTTRAYSSADLKTAFVNLEVALKAKQSEVRLTNRAGTHIHLNMQHQTLRTFFGFLMMFVAVEPVLLRLCGPERNGSLFCLPSFEAGGWDKFIQNCQRAIATGGFERYWPGENNQLNRGKYSCLNVDPLVRFGSVEIRCFPNTDQAKHVLTWCDWLLALRVEAVNWKKADYSDLIPFMYEHPREFAQNIFSGQPLYTVCAPQNVSDMVQAGVEQAYEIYKASKHLFELKDTPVNKVIKKARTTFNPAPPPPLPQGGSW